MKNWTLLIVVALGFNIWAGSKVGNGDDGGDLEGAVAVKSGPILESRQKAVELLKKLNVDGIPGLGGLIPEVRDSELYISEKSVEATLEEDKGIYHSNMSGQVYARTFAEPHAPTRFFPAAEKLSEDQLIALHIHEGLHRALPADIRENEAVVSEITLSVASPSATHDRIMATANKYVKTTPPVAASPIRSDGSQMTYKVVPDDSRVKNPSTFGYTYRAFRDVDQDMSFPLTSMHTIQSFMYPFGSDFAPLGIGIEASFLRTKEQSQMGPLGLSARSMIWTYRGFDVGVWGTASLNVLSSEEMKNSSLGRDVFTAGLSVRKALKHFYLENVISYSAPGSAKQKIGPIEYQHEYGGIVTAGVHPGFIFGKLHLGGFAEVYLADYYRVRGGEFSYDSGRYRIVAIGPEIKWVEENFSINVFGRSLIDSTKNANFDYLGNVMGAGVAQGYIGGGVNVYF